MKKARCFPRVRSECAGSAGRSAIGVASLFESASRTLPLGKMRDDTEAKMYSDLSASAVNDDKHEAPCGNRMRNILMKITALILVLAPYLATPAFAQNAAVLAPANEGQLAATLRDTRAAAERGNADAQYKLGAMYAEDRGIEHHGVSQVSFGNCTIVTEIRVTTAAGER